MPEPSPVSIHELLQRYEVLLLDAYGVLVHHGGALPGARDLIEQLNQQGRDYFILTNDASRLPSTNSARFAEMGLKIPAARIITSGSLLAEHFAAAGLQGRASVVLGPEDSRRYVEQAGGRVTSVEDLQAEVVVICDEIGYPFVETLDHTLTLLFHRLDNGLPLSLVLPNPDLVYPKSESGFGFTAGSIALMLEAALRQRYGEQAPGFVRLGKPNAPIFAEAARRVGGRSMVMVGDQLQTDILGAVSYGLPAALATTGLDGKSDLSQLPADALPTFLLEPLRG